MRTTVKRLAMVTALAALAAVGPAASAFAAAGAPTPSPTPVPTVPTGPAPVVVDPPAGPRTVRLLLSNTTGCHLVLLANNLTAGTYYGFPPAVVDNGTKIVANATTPTGDVTGQVDYGLTCGPVDSPIVHRPQDIVDLTFNAPYVGVASYGAKSMYGTSTVTITKASVISGSIYFSVTVS